MSKQFIGIMIDDGPSQLAGILGILKSGSTFVPINPVFPEDRVHFIIRDLGIRILLTDRSNLEKARHIASGSDVLKHVVDLDDLPGEAPAPALAEKTEEETRSVDDNCYVIYTSGSTGKPKGVPITHANLLPLFYWFRDYFGLGEHTRVMQNLSYTFDFGVFEILTTLIYGGCMAVPGKKVIGDFRAYGDFIHRHEINTVHTTPVFFGSLVATGIEMPTLKLVHLGGERLTGKVVRDISRVVPADCRIFNGYGPTEATINCSIFCVTAAEGLEIAEETEIPIGRATAYNELFVLDPHNNPRPVGVAGELCVAGAGVADGYINRPQLTGERFFDFNGSDKTNKSYRTYRTGDLVCWLPDGNVRFLGRIDHQVKVRGYRIELGEIEDRLLKHEDVKDAVVIARQHDNGSNYLSAYFAVHSGETVGVPRMREHLSRELPDYMIPAYIIQLEEMPLNVNGKIDRKALPAPDAVLMDVGVEYTAPETAVEKELVNIWSQLLPVETIGTGDDFFELGGDSILVNQCIARIREALHVDLPMRTFFERPYIRGLAEEIEGLGRDVTSFKLLERKGEIPLSFAQERLWFLQELDADNAAYYVPRVIRMIGGLDVTLLERTFTEIIRRHEILRTAFPAVEGRPVQRIREPYYFKIPTLDWSGEADASEKVTRFLEEESRRAFDFETGTLLRVTALKLGENEHLMVLTEHHLIHDGWTQGVLLREVIAIFSAYREGREHALGELSIQYADYAVWQRETLQGEVLERHLDYWKNRMAGLAPVLDLPFDRPRPPVISGEGGLKIFRLSAEFSRRLKDYSRRNGATLYMTMLAAFKVLLYRYTGVGDLCVGAGIANRRYKEMEGMLGMVINTLPLRTQVTGDASFRECLNRVKTTCLDAYQHEDTPFGKIVEVLRPERNLSYMPLFQVMFSFMDTPGDNLRLPGLELQLVEFHNRSAKFDISIVVVPPPENEDDNEALAGEMLVEWEYNTDIFDDSTTERMTAHYERLLHAIVEHGESNVSALPMMGPDEVAQLLHQFNDTAVDHPFETTVHRLFEEQVENNPHRIAVIGSSLRGDAVSLTYGELDCLARRWSALLRQTGVRSGAVVGLLADRSVEMIAGMLGVLKADAAYLPIDPDYPRERIRYMLADSGARVLLSQSSHMNGMSGLSEDIETFRLDELSNESSLHASPAGSASTVTPDGLAYVIYTSGSTGRPKGVLIKHRGLTNMIYSHREVFGETARSRCSQVAAPGFDAMGFEVWPALTVGAALHIAPEPVRANPVEMKNWLIQREITVSFLPTVMAEALLDESWPEQGVALRVVRAAGDRLKKFPRRAYPFRLYNLYGPTEDTVWTTWAEVPVIEEGLDMGRFPTIGKPVDNHRVYILSAHLTLQPVGAPGELCIGGVGLAVGYLNQPELTAERFAGVNQSDKIDTSHGSCLEEDKLYRTGDLARRLPDGHIEFLGRIDQQIKVRGFRIELGEIESRLAAHEDVKEAVVIAGRSDNGDTYLCAYYTGNVTEDAAAEADPLREYLSRSLPGYMMPAFFVKLEEIPLTPNGKIDRNALPEPGGRLQREYAAPTNDVEKKLVEIWADVLGVNAETLGVTADFFELGGHSLNATLVVSRMHKAFNVKTPLAEFFKRGCIRETAQYIESASKETFTALQPAETMDFYPLSPAQKRLYFIYKMDEQSTAYHIPSILVLEGGIDKQRLEKVFAALIDRHESLRTSFHIIDEQPVQKIHSDVTFSLTPYPLSLISDFVRPFDLSKAPLMRAALVEETGGKHLLMVDMHHIITDGTSLTVFIKDFIAFYQGEALPAPRIHYKDFSQWLHRERTGERFQSHKQYWLEQYRDAPPALELPVDFPRPVMQSFEGRTYRFDIGAGDSSSLNELAAARGVTLHTVLLTLYYTLLSKLSGQRDIVVGIPTAGRDHADLEPIIGMFVNTLALRNRPEGEKTFTTFLNEVNQHSLEAFAHQDYQYEELVEQVVEDRDTGRNPLFDVMLLLKPLDITEVEIPGLKLSPYPYEEKISKFDLTLRVYDAPGNVQLTFEYCTALFKTETIERFARFFLTLVSRVIAAPDVVLSDISLLSEAEKQHILVEFNDTASDYPDDKTIHQLFEEQVALGGDRVAIISHRAENHAAVTYKELNRRADHLAGLLVRKGVEPNRIVGLMAGRSINMLIGILGILKAGGAYLPIDLEYPLPRIRYMLDDTHARILVGDETELSKVSEVTEDLDTVCLDGYARSESLLHAGRASASAGTPGGPAYVIYTSGTTGKPKGVLTMHYNVVRVVRNTHYIDITADDRLLQLSNYAFDGSVFDIYGALLNGAALVLTEKDDVFAVERLHKILTDHRVTVFFVTTALFNALVDGEPGFLKRIRKVLFGGERVSLDHAVRAFEYAGNGKIIHVYGPTETTVFATFHPIDAVDERLDTIPIGKPPANTSVYILDEYLNPVPIGVPGMMYIGGKGTARGYLNNPELSSERFIDNPFAAGDRLYATGDVARFLPDGGVVFMGRKDHQVKIRGFRIELEEIEAQLSNVEGIETAAVVIREMTGGDKTICAYIVPHVRGSMAAAELSQLREYLSGRLPHYMVPSYIIPMEAIPLNPSGKIDRKALPEPGAVATGEEHTAPRDDLEKQMVGVWADVLAVETDRIGIDTSFFHLGGHSLKATLLASRMHKAFKVEISLREVLLTPTIRAMAGIIREREKTAFIEPENVENKEYYPLSFNQHRLHVLHQLNPQSPAYNMPVQLPMEYDVDESVVRTVLETLVERHESLRTGFKIAGNTVVQTIADAVDIPYRFVDLSPLEGGSKQQELDRLHREINGAPFDLETVPLFRAALVKRESQRYEFLFNIHHILCDGWSLDLLQKEFYQLYHGYIDAEVPALEPPVLRYRDFQHWHQQRMTPAGPHQKSLSSAYWEKRLADGFPVVRLPHNIDANAQKTGGAGGRAGGAGYRFTIGKELKDRLLQLAENNGATLFSVMFSVYMILLNRLSGSDDVGCSVIIAGRAHASFRDVVGLFVNSILLGTRVDETESFETFLRRVNSEVLEAFQYQDHPMESVFEALNMRYPEVPVSFNMLNMQDVTAGRSLDSFESFHSDSRQDVKFDVEPYITEYENGIDIRWVYRKHFFKPRTIEEMTQWYVELLESFTRNPEGNLKAQHIETRPPQVRRFRRN